MRGNVTGGEGRQLMLMRRKRSRETTTVEPWHDAFVSSVSELITVHDSDGTVLYVTPSVSRFAGSPASASMRSKDALIAIHPDDRQGVRDAFHAWTGDALSTESVQYRARRSDGSWRTMEAVGQSFPTADGGRGVVVTSRDCTLSDANVGARFISELLLQRAIEAGEFVVHYQPEMDIATGELRGFEALARWEDPNRGIVMPDAFIELAETTGLIVPLGRAILTLACQQMATLHRSIPCGTVRPWISVNVSGCQLTRPDFVDEVASVLQASGLDPDTLWLEITETVLMADLDASRRALDRLRGLGVHMSIDDFGTGWSSLAQLKRFPVEQLKIDRSFTAGVGRDADDTTIITAIIAMAHSLGISVVAEGVETTTHLAALGQLRCDIGQGYLWSRPMPFDTIASWTEQHPRWTPTELFRPPALVERVRMLESAGC